MPKQLQNIFTQVVCRKLVKFMVCNLCNISTKYCSKGELMKLKTKYILLVLLIITLIFPSCSASKLQQGGADDSTPSADVSENEDSLLGNMSRDTKMYLADFCADNDINLNIKEDVLINWYYDYHNILNISFDTRNIAVFDRLLIMRNVGYYIQDWINENYSVEGTPLYEIQCCANYTSSSTQPDEYIRFANFNCLHHRDIDEAKPARSIEYVDLQVNYGESRYQDIFFEGVKHLQTEHTSVMEDFSPLKHFLDLESVTIPIITPKTDEEIRELVDSVKQYCPPDCEITTIKM